MFLNSVSRKTSISAFYAASVQDTIKADSVGVEFVKSHCADFFCDGEK